MKAQTSLETLLLITALISIILITLPIFFNLKQLGDKSFEKLHLKNTANQLLYYCEKSFFFEDLRFDIQISEKQRWKTEERKLILSSENFQEEINFPCLVSEDLEKGEHYFEITNHKIQKIY